MEICIHTARRSLKNNFYITILGEEGLYVYIVYIYAYIERKYYIYIVHLINFLIIGRNIFLNHHVTLLSYYSYLFFCLEKILGFLPFCMLDFWFFWLFLPCICPFIWQIPTHFSKSSGIIPCKKLSFSSFPTPFI